VPLSVLELTDLDGPPKAKIDLPLVRLGDRLHFDFKLRRVHGGRTEVLAVSGEYKVIEFFTDATNGARQVVRVAATGKAPTWQAVKKDRPRQLAPARSPKVTLT